MFMGGMGFSVVIWIQLPDSGYLIAFRDGHGERVQYVPWYAAVCVLSYAFGDQFIVLQLPPVDPQLLYVVLR